MGGRRLLVGNEVFCLFATSHHLGKERKGKGTTSTGNHLFIHSFIQSIVQYKTSFFLSNLEPNIR